MGTRKHPIQHLFFVLVLGLFFALPGHTQITVRSIPELNAHITDEIGLLTPSQRQNLEKYLVNYEQKTGNQIAILLIDNTASETIEQYSIRVADQWKLGRKGIDDGVLLIVAKNNPSELKRLRIETGRGVQGVLTDMRSKQILQDILAPHFRQNDFYNGLAAGITAITATLDKEVFPANRHTDRKEKEASWFPFLIPILFFIFVVLRSHSSRRLGKHGHWGTTGIILGGELHDRFRNHDDFGSTGSGGLSGGGGKFDGGGASGDW